MSFMYQEQKKYGLSPWASRQHYVALDKLRPADVIDLKAGRREAFSFHWIPQALFDVRCLLAVFSFDYTTRHSDSWNIADSSLWCLQEIRVGAFDTPSNCVAIDVDPTS